MKCHKKDFEKGQATAEFVVSLIGILAVITGLFMIVDIGVAKVQNVSEARGQADNYAAIGLGGAAGRSIRYWDDGDDGYLYTEDDEPIVSTTEDPDIFSSELSNGTFSLRDDFSLPYVENNFAESLPPDRVFLPAASLTSSRVSKTVELDGATRTLFFNTPSLSLSDTIYMPLF